MQHFDVNTRSEIDAKKTHRAPKGLLHLVCSAPAALYVSQEGYEVLYGYGTEFKLKSKAPMEYRLAGQKDLVAFIEQPLNQSYSPQGEIFTNMDRQPMESGSMLEVSRELRIMRLQAASIRADMLKDFKRLKAKRKASEAPAEPAEPSVTPEPKGQEEGAE